MPSDVYVHDHECSAHRLMDCCPLFVLKVIDFYAKTKLNVVYCTSPMSSSAQLMSRPRDASAPLPHCCGLSVVQGCPLSVIEPSLLLLPML